MPNTRRKSDDKQIFNNLYKYIAKHSHYFILFSILFFAVIIVLTTFSTNVNPVNSEKNTVFEEAWQLSVDDGKFQEVTLPATFKGVVSSHLTLKNTIPAELVKGATLLLRTSQQNVEVYIDGTFLYSSHDKGLKSSRISGSIGSSDNATPSSAYHFVRLPTDAHQKEITIVLNSPYERYAGFMNEIYIGSKASHVFFLFGLLGLRFIIGLIVFIIGMVLTIAFLFSKKQENSIGIINLGCFFICAGFWVLSESKLLQFLIPFPTTVTNLGIFCLSLLPVCSGIYYLNIHVKHCRKLMKAAIIMSAIASLMLAIISIFHSTLPLILLPYLISLLGIYIVILVTVIILEYRFDKKSFVASVWGVIIFGGCGLIELISYLSNIKAYNESNYFTIGLFLFCVMMMVDLALNFTKAYQAAVVVNTLTALAYTDSLTGLYNHTSFLEKLPSINLKDNVNISLAVFDINNLKVVNDTKGHLMGDAMLKHCAAVLRNSVRAEDHVYRIGGDEFAAIMFHDGRFDPATVETRLEKILIQENTDTCNYQLSIACGYATFTKYVDEDLFATFARADEKMYERKKKQKRLL